MIGYKVRRKKEKNNAKFCHLTCAGDMRRREGYFSTGTMGLLYRTVCHSEVTGRIVEQFLSVSAYTCCLSGAYIGV